MVWWFTRRKSGKDYKRNCQKEEKSLKLHQVSCQFVGKTEFSLHPTAWPICTTPKITDRENTEFLCHKIYFSNCTFSTSFIRHRIVSLKGMPLILFPLHEIMSTPFCLSYRCFWPVPSFSLS